MCTLGIEGWPEEIGLKTGSKHLVLCDDCMHVSPTDSSSLALPRMASGTERCLLMWLPLGFIKVRFL